MPSHKAFDKQCLNTHSRPNPTVIRPSESSSFPSANAQKLFRFILPWQVSICTSLNTKLLCSVLSADLDALFCDWQNTSCCLENKLLLFRVYWVCPELSPPQHVHTQLLLIFDILKKLGKKNRTWDNRSTSSSNCPQMKIFWSWLLTEGSWEISKTFLGKHRVSSKQGLSEPRNLSNRARLVVTNDPWESGKNSESVMAPIKERDNTSQLCFFCQWGAKFACAMIRSFKNQRKRHS